MVKSSTLSQGLAAWGFFFTALYCTKTALSKFKCPQKSGVFAFSNNVGYQNYATRAGYKLCAASFITAADENGQFSLADIKAEGYTLPSYNTDDPTDPYWENGIGSGSFQINVLSDEGRVLETYEYVDVVEGAMPTREDPENDDQGTGWWWVDPQGVEESVKLTDAQMKAKKFDIGQAFYLMNASGEELNLGSAGQVTADDISYPAQAGYTCIGNGTAGNTTLFNLLCKGYTLPSYNTDDPTDPYWENGIGSGAFQINVLSDEGRVLETYEYVDVVEGAMPTRDDPENDDQGTGWWTVDPQGVEESVKMTESEMKAIAVNAGDSYYVMNASGEELSLYIPSAL